MDIGTAAILGAAIGGAAGVAGQLVASYLGRGREREARTQARLERTYERVMSHVNRRALTIHRTEPTSWFGDKPPKLPKALSEDEMIDLESLIGLFGSDAVRAELLEFNRLHRDFITKLGTWHLLAAPTSGAPSSDRLEAHNQAEQARLAVWPEVVRIEALMRAELRGNRPHQPKGSVPGDSQPTI